MKRNRRNVLNVLRFTPAPAPVVRSKVELEICLKNKDGCLRLYSK